MMKKIGRIIYFTIIILTIVHSVLYLNKVDGKSVFLNSYWNVTGLSSEEGLNDWNEAGKVDFSVLDYAGTIYIKNDYSKMYFGILFPGEITDSLTWRLNFDVDVDGGWSEDCKEMRYIKTETTKFSYEDKYYFQNNPQPFSDVSTSDDFTASMRTFTLLDNPYTIFEVTVPFQTNDLLQDLQIQDPETTIIGFSMDVFKVDLAQNGSWMGGQHPNYANASNFAHILFAGPQDRKVPQFEEEAPPTTTTTTTTTRTTTRTELAPAASSFEVLPGLLALLSMFLIYRRYKRRSNS